MRCSVTAAMKLSEEDIENAYVAAAAISKAMPHIIERERKKNG